MKANVQDGLNEEIFDYLIGQEQEHLILFEELVKMVTRPEEWVESAEFGIREDY
jgi:rubrerythrin